MVRRILADRVSSSRYAASQVVQAKLDGVPSRDSKGRIAHVLGIEFDGTIDLTTTTTTNDAVPGYAMLQKYGSIFLEDVSGHQYLSAVDGRVLIDDIFFRNSALGENAVPTGLSANVGTAQSNALALRLFFPFVRLEGTPSLRGAIPLKAIKDRGEQALRFTVNALSGYTSVTDAGFTELNIWLWVVYLPALYTDPGWQLESYTIDDKNGRLWHADRLHEYAIVRPMPEDSATLSGYAGITVQADGDTVVSAYSYAEMTDRDNLVYRQELTAQDADLPGSEAAFSLLPRVKTTRAMAGGPITFNYSTRSDSTTRYAHRTVLCQQARRAKEIARSVLGCEPSDAKVKAVPVKDDMSPTSFAADPSAGLLVQQRLSRQLPG